MTAKAPELQKGIRILYRDGDGAARAERIHTRKGNTLTVINALKQKTRITIDQVKGYWKPKVRANPKNLIPLTTEAQHGHKRGKHGAV